MADENVQKSDVDSKVLSDSEAKKEGAGVKTAQDDKELDDLLDSRYSFAGCATRYVLSLNKHPNTHHDWHL